MKTDNVYKIDCTTISTYRNTKTGETFKEKKEGPDIVEDVNQSVVTITAKKTYTMNKEVQDFYRFLIIFIITIFAQ